MHGLMQDWPLPGDKILGPPHAWGGDRVAPLAWNTGRHVEAWYGIMGVGAVCHTLNPRLFADQLCYIINHAEDKIIFTDITFGQTLAQYRAQMPTVKHFVVLCDEAQLKECPIAGSISYETLISRYGDDCEW